MYQRRAPALLADMGCLGCTADTESNRMHHDDDCLLRSVSTVHTLHVMGTQTAQKPQVNANACHLDGSDCFHPELCAKTTTVFIFGGRPEHPDNQAD